MNDRLTNPGKAALGALSRPSLLASGSWIGGRWVGGSKGVDVIDPATLLTVSSVAWVEAGAVDEAIFHAGTAMAAWQRRLPRDRGKVLRNWAGAIRAHRDDLATIITVEQGKPLSEARGEVEYGAAYLDWFAAEGERHAGQILPAHRSNMFSMNYFQPVGVSVAITPWNFPLAMITRKAAAALAAGCAMIVKPAPETPLTANALAVLASGAGLPAGLFQVLNGAPEPVTAALLAHPQVRAMSFTGSTRVGRILLAQAAHTVKRTSMELGGNAPFIIFDDADLEAAVDGCMAAKFATSGQDCLAANRIYVHESLHDAFVARFAKRVAALRLGHGLLGDTEIGPMTVPASVEKCRRLIASATAGGAEIVTGGGSPRQGSRFVRPAVLIGVKDDMEIAREEIFAPLAPVLAFQDTDEVIARANMTEMGLAAYIHTRSLDHAQIVSAALEFGMVAVNAPAFTGAAVPFGGWKQSGLGREGSLGGIYEYLENKSVSIGGLTFGPQAAA